MNTDLSVRSPDHGSERRSGRLFYVASNTSQNYLLCPFLQTLFVINSDFPKTGGITKNTPQLITHAAQAQEWQARHPQTTLADPAPEYQPATEDVKKTAPGVQQHPEGPQQQLEGTPEATNGPHPTLSLSPDAQQQPRATQPTTEPEQQQQPSNAMLATPGQR